MPTHANIAASHVAIPLLDFLSLRYLESIDLVVYVDVLLLTHLTVALKGILPVIHRVDVSADFAPPLAILERNLDLRFNFLLLLRLFLRRL